MTLRMRTQLSALAVVLAGFGVAREGGWLWALLLTLSVVMLATNLALTRARR